MQLVRITALLSVLCWPCHCNLGTILEEKLLKFVIPQSEDEVSKEIAREVLMEATEMIAHYGYVAENHTVQTKDGYILGVHRIPKSKSGSLPHQPYPIFLQHGVLCCSGNFIDNADDSLAFFLADLGYDVWLGNLRGNHYSKKHLTLSPDSDKFWDFSWDEHADHDLPSMIDYVLSRTGKDQILLIAHSLGTTIAFSMLASQPQYNTKVKGFLALGPVASITYIPSFSRLFAKNSEALEFAANAAHLNQFLTRNKFLENAIEYGCPSSKPTICSLIISLYAGYDLELVNRTRIPVYTSDCASGTSTKVLKHLAQLYHTHKLARYDYGREKNVITYGQESPPKYKLNLITTPVIMVHGANDALANPLDVELLTPDLKSLVLKELYPNPMGAHSAYFWATNASLNFYSRVRELVKILQE